MSVNVSVHLIMTACGWSRLRSTTVELFLITIVV
jgi:hypothetical protein